MILEVRIIRVNERSKDSRFHSDYKHLNSFVHESFDLLSKLEDSMIIFEYVLVVFHFDNEQSFLCVFCLMMQSHIVLDLFEQ